MKTYYEIYVISSAGAIIKRFNAGTDAHAASDAMRHIASACPVIYPLGKKLHIVGRCDGEVVLSRYREV
jgi:hypothetical protein